ncbi:unnamed protein product [Closterium sp. NIES-53]
MSSRRAVCAHNGRGGRRGERRRREWRRKGVSGQTELLDHELAVHIDVQQTGGLRREEGGKVQGAGGWGWEKGETSECKLHEHELAVHIEVQQTGGLCIQGEGEGGEGERNRRGSGGGKG